MKIRIGVSVGLAVAMVATAARAWNIGGHLDAINFKADGGVSFTLFQNGTSGPLFQCNPSSHEVWLRFPACAGSDAACQAALSRAANLLVQAKIGNKVVHSTQTSECVVSEIALKE